MERNRSRSFMPQARAIPPKFAERILQLEMDLDFQCNLPTLKQLLELYSLAIEHYESIKDTRHIQYQERMQNLLMKREVLEVMQSGKNEQSNISETKLIKKKSETDQNRKIRAQRLNKQITKLNTNSIQSIVESNVTQSVKSSKEIRKQRTSQNENLKNRLAQRIRRKSEEPAPVRKVSDSLSRRFFEESDKSAGGSRLNQLNANKSDFDLEYEKIIENYVEKKVQVTQEIKAKYLPQIKEVEAQASPMSIMIVGNLKVEMSKEILEATLLLEELKKIEIADLKSRLCKA